MTFTKRFVTYKDKHPILKSNVISPIQTGRDLANENFENMIGDNTGDNISYLNHTFCELTAIYWVWKNQDKVGNPDNIGFMHYRRHFLFGNKDYIPNYFGLVKFDKINANYLKSDLTSDKNIVKICSNYDAVIPLKIDIELLGNYKNNYEQYKKCHNIKDYDKAIEIISSIYPDYIPYVKEYNKSKHAYFLNMFIFKKDIFNEYCSWIFDILFRLYDSIQISQTDNYQQRTIGFISERLTAIFIYKLLREKHKILELPVSFVDKFLKLDIVNHNIIPIAVASSNSYVPILSVFLESIKNNINNQYIYEVNILERDISIYNKQRLIKQCNKFPISLKFVNINKKLDGLEKLVKKRHFSVDTFSRFFIPNLLDYDKCIYLDIDTIVTTDIQKLYNIDIKNNYIAACNDPIFIGMCNRNKKLEEYTRNTLKLEKCENYFQTGVMLLNLKQLREINSENLCINSMMKKVFNYADQCCYNYLFNTHIKYLDMSWNYQIYDQDRYDDNIKGKLPLKYLQMYNVSRKEPKIIHYSGPRKPWFYPNEEFGDIWWNYARKSPFYEQILINFIKFNLSQKKQSKNSKISLLCKLYKKIRHCLLCIRVDLKDKNFLVQFLGIRISHKKNGKFPCIYEFKI